MFENLTKFVNEQNKQRELTDIYRPASDAHKRFYDACRDISFYHWEFLNDESKHDELARKTNNTCCFSHLIGLPLKNGVKHHMYGYEYDVFRELHKPKPSDTDNIIKRQQHKHCAIIKATGLGISEFFLRWIAWMCVRNDNLQGQRVCIITGPNIALAITLIKRLKELFLNPESEHQLVFDTKETVIVINGCLIQAFPSHNLSASRGLTNVAIVLQDEASFFELNQASEAIDISHRYIAKSNPYLIVISTPNKPGDMLHRITEQKEEQCIYKRMYLPYNVGLPPAGNIFTQQEIEIAKRSSSFNREYDLKFAGITGTVFLESKIQAAIALGDSTDLFKLLLKNPKAMIETQFYCAIDPSFGSSRFAICLVAVVDDYIYVIDTEELEREEFNVCIDTAIGVMEKYGISRQNIIYFVDSSSPAVCTAIMAEMGDKTNYTQVIEFRKKQNLRDVWYDYRTVPINFSHQQKRNLLLNAKQILDNNMIVLDRERHSNLILALRTAVADDLILDKQHTQHHDILDAFCMCLSHVTVAKD